MSDDVAYWRRRAERAELAADQARAEVDRLKAAMAPGADGLDDRLARIIRTCPELWSLPTRERPAALARTVLLLVDNPSVSAARLRPARTRWDRDVDETRLAAATVSQARWLITDLVRLAGAPDIPLIIKLRGGDYLMSVADRQVMRQIIDRVVAAHDAATASLRPVEAV